MYQRSVNSNQLTDRLIQIIDIYNYIHRYRTPVYPWQWDYEYEDEMMGQFYIDELAALNGVEELVKDGEDYRAKKLHSAKVAQENSEVSQPHRPKFRFASR